MPGILRRWRHAFTSRQRSSSSRGVLSTGFTSSPSLDVCLYSRVRPLCLPRRVDGSRAGQWTLREGAEAQVASLPEGLQALLLRRIEARPPARRVLEAASVVGEAFAVAAVAAGAQEPVEDGEAVCTGLAAQRHFLDDTGWTVWPDATQRRAVSVSACAVPAGALRVAGDGAAGAAAPAHWRAAGGGLWGAGGGDCGPVGRPL